MDVLLVTGEKYFSFLMDCLDLDYVNIRRIIMPNGPFQKTFDIEYNGRNYTGSPYETLQDLALSMPYDYIILCGYEQRAIEELKEIKIPKEKILDARLLYMPQFLEKAKLLHALKRNFVMRKPQILITGSSYAYHGTEITAYSLPAINVSGISQDLYYDYLLARELLALPGHKFRYAVMGIGPFSFHHDMSFSNENYRIFAYLLALGDTHNYHVNRQELKNIFRPCMERALAEISKETRMFNFNDPIGLRTQLNFCFGSEQRLRARQRAEVWRVKRFPATMKENIHILRQYIAFCQSKNVMPVLVVFPATDIYRAFFSRQMIAEFYNILKRFKEAGNIVLDYWAADDFQYRDFYDVDHLNRVGAMKVSTRINRFLSHV